MRSEVQGGPLAGEQARVYVWQAPGLGVAIHLDLAVVRRLGEAIRQRAQANAGRAEEIGGVLLGSVHSGEPVLTQIDGFEVFPSSHVRGPSYVLAMDERRGLEKRLARLAGGKAGLRPVGYFRVHSRPGLYLDEADLSLMREFFAGPGDVALLVGETGEALKAGFFFWENGDMHRQAPYLAFPFDEGALASGGHRVVGRAGGRSAVQDWPPAAPGARPAPPAPKSVRPPWMSARVWIVGAAIAGVMLLAGAGARKLMQMSSSGGVSSTAPALRAEKADGGLRLKWDGRAQAVKAARRGALNITDGENRFSLPLTAAQLALGSVMYFPLAEDVAFEFVLYGPRGESRASLRTFLPAAPGSRPAAWRELPQLSEALPGFPPPGAQGVAALPAARPVQRASARAHRYGKNPEPKAFRGVPRQEAAGARSMALQPPPHLPAMPPEPAPVAPFATELYRKAGVTVRPAPSAGLLRKIPLLRRLRRKPPQGDGDFVAARPVTRVQPLVPPTLEVSQDVDVKVRIDESGGVSGTEVLTKGAGALLANAAETAAQDWRFEPAQKNGREVPSELVLRFQFER